MGGKIKKPDSAEIEQLKGIIAQNWIAIISVGALFSMGAWMLIDPSPKDHASIEKATVSLIKDIWSWQVGAIICSLTFLYILNGVFKIRKLNGYVWIKYSKGYYLIINKVRVKGLASLWDGDDLVIFHPDQNQVFTLVDYENQQENSYQKAKINKTVNCTEAYWTAGNSGYNLFYQGKKLNNTTSELKGTDLIVADSELNKKFKLKDYNTNLDSKIRKPEIM